MVPPPPLVPVQVMVTVCVPVGSIPVSHTFGYEVLAL